MSDCPPGEVFHECRVCPRTCAELTNESLCTTVCERGCGCPEGELFNEEENRCVSIDECPSMWSNYYSYMYVQCSACTNWCLDFNCCLSSIYSVSLAENVSERYFIREVIVSRPVGMYCSSYCCRPVI